VNPAWADLATLTHSAAWIALAGTGIAHLIVFGLACGLNRARGGAKPW
jgi:hypothetical protein